MLLDGAWQSSTTLLAKSATNDDSTHVFLAIDTIIVFDFIFGIRFRLLIADIVASAELERRGNVINDRGNFAIILLSLSRVHCVEYANALADRKQLTCLSLVYRALSIVEPALSYRLLRKLSPKQLLTVVSRFRESQRKIEKTRRTSFGDNSPPTCNAATSVGFDVDSTSNTCFPLNGSQRQPLIHIKRK